MPLTPSQRVEVAEACVTGRCGSVTGDGRISLSGFGYLLELARKVYPDRRWLDDGGVYYWLEPEERTDWRFVVPFNPSLTGAPEQRLQALDCIVAAFKLSKSFSITKTEDDEFFYEAEPPLRNSGLMWGDDLLQVSIAALLGEKRE